ncbi:lipoprotein-anchoring transpeptidase ErfK/SrfK [Ochrobactrum daejeonense]|uniref:Lipoprotein-anchoring transpeptidase ErfK/SrfK n=1 Tax=Brucella daejeonensis TaxID=659015 RepID=A0A7W9ELE3_9HYPH|nr:L,D-transpeptidase [Brucella daejeonensis]MBB5702269.1 lipoprotein-anchoring transpeptidase ErfK/SrfK [Brucella daejeonensis]
MVLNEKPDARRSLLRVAVVACLPFAAAACTTASADRPVAVTMPQPVAFSPEPVAEAQPEVQTAKSEYEAMYGAVNDRGNLIPALDLDKIAGRNLRRQVDYATSEPVGTIVVDPYARYLYLVQPGGKALRYSVGVGRAGLTFKGDAKVAYKSQWPRWTPTANMIKRNPDHYAKYAKGLEGGIRNPLGARALYLYRDGKDTLYRIHGTNEPWSVGKAASSGCIRLYNQDILDLYKRIPAGARVVVLDKGQSRTQSGKGASS